MKKSAIRSLPEYYHRYIEQVPDVDLIDSLKMFRDEILPKEIATLHALHHSVYAPEKWTVHDIMQHLIDGERIFSYRALCFAREDKTSLPSFDENSYASTAQATRRSLDDLLEEFYIVRNSTIKLFESFNNDQLMKEGISSTISISVLALGFTISGHGIHHLNVIKEKYYPLLSGEMLHSKP